MLEIDVPTNRQADDLASAIAMASSLLYRTPRGGLVRFQHTSRPMGISEWLKLVEQGKARKEDRAPDVQLWTCTVNGRSIINADTKSKAFPDFITAFRAASMLGAFDRG